jgi:hypothetical protein
MIAIIRAVYFETIKMTLLTQSVKSTERGKVDGNTSINVNNIKNPGIGMVYRP